MKLLHNALKDEWWVKRWLSNEGAYETEWHEAPKELIDEFLTIRSDMMDAKN